MATKRLYIGGLSHTISEKDLKDRFGKFGVVQDVELLTRKDEDGVPYKTFGYININISDADYKRCVTVLNKSKWKGGMLEIEVAKESFLHRLAQERQQAAKETQPLPEDEKEKFVESLKSAGVENFHMKAAVPGTEVPGHKDWVVSKFGRVLPVLHLKGQGKNKIMKYDPSKHSHNIKKLESSADVPSLTPVSQLTWEILEANDDISKKRRGEFPPLKTRSSKIRKDSSSKLTANSQSDVSINGGCKKSNGSLDKGQSYGGENKPTRQTPAPTKSPAPTKQAPAPTKLLVPSVCVFDDGVDSDEEIRMLVPQQPQQDPTADDDDNDNLEVVGDDFKVMKTKTSHHPSVRPSGDDETAYDSADTDEILTSSKTPKVAEQPKPEACSQSCQIATNSSEKDTTEVKKSRKKVPSEFKPHLSESDCDDNEEEEEVESEDYEAMFTNCHRLEISLADLEQLVKESSNSPLGDDENGSDSQAGPSQVLEAIPIQQTNACKSSLPKKGTTPEEILAAILAEDSGDEETGKKKKKKKTPSVSLPAFQGTKALIGTLQNTEEDGRLKRQLDDAKTEVVSKKKKLKTPVELNHSALDANAKTVNSPLLIADSISSSVSSFNEAFESNGEQNDVPKKVVLKDSDGVQTKRLSKTEKVLQKSDSSSESESSEEEEVSPKDLAVMAKQSEEKTDLPKRPQQVSDPGKQQQDNQRRLAAMEQRQKEAEQQKKLIQGALAVCTPTPAHKSNHIVFGSDDESDEGGQSSLEVSTPTPKKSLFQDSQCFEEGNHERTLSASRKASSKEENILKQDASKLFDSSEDDDDDVEEDAEDGERFQIKPQFEGKSGQKLMQLQSRFGTDERFHMDSRFLESDDESEVTAIKSVQNEVECELEEEKKKNLDILQNLLKINIQTSDNSKASTKGKTFRDISALQYDPTREEHAAFETKTEEPKKESKKARRKQREEAEKLPDVSKEIYYDVAVDLKAAFGTTKENMDEEKAIAWDKEEEKEEEEEEEEKEKQSEAADAETRHPSPFLPSGFSAEKEEEGFMFSFFGDKAEADNSSLIDEYKVETLKQPKASWQADPRFQDSSSEDEVEDEETAAPTATEQPVPRKKAFFFFHQDDERLKEGPRTFYRSANLEDHREQWEEKRMSLIEEYRKKHKDARRKLRASQRNGFT